MGVVVRCLLLYPTCLVVVAEVAGYLTSWKVYQYRLVVVAVVVDWKYIHAGMGAGLLLGRSFSWGLLPGIEIRSWLKVGGT
jgi:hypothetical protein